MKYIIYSIVALVFCTSLFSCTSVEGPTDTQTSGYIKVSVDECYKLVMEQQFQVFMSRYPDAHITVEYKPEADCFKDFFEDSTRVIFVTRELTKQENDYALEKKIVARSLPMARDAVAFITSTTSKENQLTLTELKEILTGASKKHTLVFDHKNSSTVRYITDSLLKEKKLDSTIYATNNSAEVVDYVSKHSNAIGVVGVSWIADTRDSTSESFMKKVQVMGIKNDSLNEYIRPYQAYIGLKTYPCIRNFYFINKETYPGLATGLVNYLCRDGQLLFKQSKLFPLQVNVLLRETNIKH